MANIFIDISEKIFLRERQHKSYSIACIRYSLLGPTWCKYQSIFGTSFELMPRKPLTCRILLIQIMCKHIEQFKLIYIHSGVWYLGALRKFMIAWVHALNVSGPWWTSLPQNPSIAHRGNVSQISWAHAPSKTKALLRGNGKHLRATLWYQLIKTGEFGFQKGLKITFTFEDDSVFDDM